VDESLAITCGAFGTCASPAFTAAVSFDELINRGGPNDAMIARFQAYIAARFPSRLPDVFVCTHPVAICRLFMAAANQSIIVLYQAVFLEFTAADVQALLRDYLVLAADPRHVLLANNRYHQAEAKLLTGYEPRYMPNLCRYTKTDYAPRKVSPYLVQISRSVAPQPISAAVLQNVYAEYTKANECPNSLRFRDFTGFSSFNEYFEDVSAVVYFPYTVSLMSAFEVNIMTVKFIEVFLLLASLSFVSSPFSQLLRPLSDLWHGGANFYSRARVCSLP
jgi:hypothetical protein